MSVTYYRIKDLDLLGKEEDYVPYLYKLGKGWVVDHDNVLMDRIMGYDESEPANSPYKIGNTSMLDLVKEISQKEADKIIANL
ncbi:hypothetical protein [Lacrimispora sp.]|uniref:hypothetical protein n=1 Tax=Lacrimispora sp. TaxID=2719234 RepID=UPI0028B112D7|nr:hypothetical protein [Lacrimispora sp.]